MTRPAVSTDRESFRRTASAAPPDARVPVEVGVRVADPFEAYRRARRGDGGDAYLATTGGQGGWGYFAVDPTERLTVDADGAVGDDGPAAGIVPAGSRSLAALRELLDGERLVRGDCDVPYPCGAVGWLSYDVARELEDLPAPLVETARTVDEGGVLMGVRHESKPQIGVQFHPESILTGTGERDAAGHGARSLDAGKRLISNFVCSIT